MTSTLRLYYISIYSFVRDVEHIANAKVNSISKKVEVLIKNLIFNAPI